MRCNSLDERTILLRLFGNRPLYLIKSSVCASLLHKVNRLIGRNWNAIPLSYLVPRQENGVLSLSFSARFVRSYMWLGLQRVS